MLAEKSAVTNLKRFKVTSAVIATLLLFASEQALADVNCSFAVDGVNLAPDGTLAASFTANAVSHYWVLCSVNSTWSNVNGSGITATLDMCKALHADLVAARTGGRSIWLTFPSLTSCAANALPAQGVPNPYYVNFGL